MLKLRQIQKAILAKLKEYYPDYKVYFDNVEKSRSPYFYVDMFVRTGIGDDTYFDKIVQVDIAFVPMPDKNNRINRAELYVMSDSLERIFRPVLRVEDRYITINDVEHTFIDEILHFIFNLEFTDAFTDEEVGIVQGEIMEELKLTVNHLDLKEEEDNG